MPPTMLYRRFGRTNLQIPVFSCGGMRYQFKWQDVPLAEVPADGQANLEATIRRSVELGINHIETARGYGSSERQLGLILPKFAREKLIVQTKIGPGDDADKFTQEFEESLTRLQLQHVDLLAIHGINDRQCLDQSIRPNGCLAAARRIQKRGLARHIGFSTHGSPQLILDAVKHEGDGGFDYVNLHWYYIYQRNWQAVLEATKRDMGVFIISPSDKGGMLYDPPEKLVELCRPLHPIVFNDLFCLDRPQVHTLSIGAARPGDFDRHLETLDLLGRASDLLPPIMARLRQAWEAAIEPALREPFSIGLPEWEDVPGNINVQIILWLHHLMTAYDMSKYAKMRYNLLGNGGHWFPGQNAGKLDETEIRPALASASSPDAVFDCLRRTHTAVGGEEVKRLSASK